MLFKSRKIMAQLGSLFSIESIMIATGIDTSGFEKLNWFLTKKRANDVNDFVIDD